jgi:hypothetical protein
VFDVVNVAPSFIMMEPVGGVKAYTLIEAEIRTPKSKEPIVISAKIFFIFSPLSFGRQN